MRLALSLKQGSIEAKAQGCTCTETNPDIDCPVHFPIRYIIKINNIEEYLHRLINSVDTLFKIVIGLLSVNLILAVINSIGG